MPEAEMYITRARAHTHKHTHTHTILLQTSTEELKSLHMSRK